MRGSLTTSTALSLRGMFYLYIIDQFSPQTVREADSASSSFLQMRKLLDVSASSKAGIQIRVHWEYLPFSLLTLQSFPFLFMEMKTLGCILRNRYCKLTGLK